MKVIKRIEKVIAIVAVIATAISFMPLFDCSAVSYAEEEWTDQAPAISVEGQESYITVSWDQIPGAVGYKVYRATSLNGKYSAIKTTKTALTYNDKKAKAGKKYYYKVRSYIQVKKKNVYGHYSEKVQGMRIMPAPGSVKAVLTGENNEDVKITWKKVTGAEGYKVLRTEVIDAELGDFTEVGTTTTLSFVDKNADPGRKYAYKVCAVATVNGDQMCGKVNLLTRRDKVLKVAIGWYHYNDGGEGMSHQEIVDIYNSVDPPGGKLSYKASWCAAYVSAVAIVAKTTSIMPIHSYCPTMLSKYKKKKCYTSKRGYIPKPGDVTFYDWERNGVPNHVGIVVEADKTHVKVIEGNTELYNRQDGGKGDGVCYRTYDPSYKLVQGYGLPAYKDTTVSMPGTLPEENETPAPELTDNQEEVIENAQDDPEKDKVDEIVESVLEESNGDQTEAAFQVYEMCKELDITASVVEMVGSDGQEQVWNEVVIDGENYIVDITEEDNAISKLHYLP